MTRLHDLLDAEPGDNLPDTARVVRSGPAGVYVASLGADTRHPIGPCRGPAHTDVNAGDVVLLIWTDDGPWIAAVDNTGGG